MLIVKGVVKDARYSGGERLGRASNNRRATGWLGVGPDLLLRGIFAVGGVDLNRMGLTIADLRVVAA